MPYSLLRGAALLAMLAAASAAQAQPLAVVELFTSQGCSSCPPANANLITVKDRPDVLALSFNVTYWDWLGWKDTFGKPEFTERQRLYEPPLGNAGPFTPQMVVNGSADTVGNRLADVEALIARASLAGQPSLSLADGKAAIGTGEIAAPADVWLVTYMPGVVEVPVSRGENTGRTLPHVNVVHTLVRLGRWNGAAMSLALPKPIKGLKNAVLVQVRRGGPILAAATE